MRISRGSNLNGYIGIKQIFTNQNYITLRPLLTTTKNEIMTFVENHNIPYAIDKSNENLKYTRNRYRHKVLPFLKTENAQIHEKYLQFSKELKSYSQFVNSYIKKNNFIENQTIDVNLIKDEDDVIKKRCLELLIEEIQKDDKLDLTDNQLQEMMKLYTKNNINIDLKNNYQGINVYGKIFIQKKDNQIFKEIIFNKDVEIGNFIFSYNNASRTENNSCICLNSEELRLPLKFRPWQVGDKMSIYHLNGHKLISDIFINAKIPKYKRSTYPILVDSNNNVLWVPNIKKSQFAKDKCEKYDIIIKCEAR